MSTKAYITAGLPCQDTRTPEPASTAVFVTAGLPACELPHTGYHLYAAGGGLDAVEFTAGATGVIPAGVSSARLVGYGFAASSRYTLVLRAVIDGAETPDLSCRTEFETDADGDYLGQRPCGVEAVSTRILSGGQVAVSWTYRTPEGRTAPHDFAVYYGGGLPIVTGSPAEVIDYLRDGRYSCTLSPEGSQSYFFGVTARGAGGVESRPSISGPVVADSTPPVQPPVIVTPVF